MIFNTTQLSSYWQSAVENGCKGAQQKAYVKCRAATISRFINLAIERKFTINFDIN